MTKEALNLTSEQVGLPVSLITPAMSTVFMQEMSLSFPSPRTSRHGSRGSSHTMPCILQWSWWIEITPLQQRTLPSGLLMALTCHNASEKTSANAGHTTSSALL